MTGRMSDERLEEIARVWALAPGHGVTDLLAETIRARAREARLAETVTAVADWAHGVSHRSGECRGSECVGCYLGKVAFDLRAALDGGAS